MMKEGEEFKPIANLSQVIFLKATKLFFGILRQEYLCVSLIRLEAQLTLNISPILQISKKVERKLSRGSCHLKVRFMKTLCIIQTYESFRYKGIKIKME